MITTLPSSITFLAGTPAAMSPSAHAPLRADEILILYTRPVNDDIYLPFQTAPEICRIRYFSPNPVTTRATHGGMVTSRQTKSLSTPEPSSSPPLYKSKNK